MCLWAGAGQAARDQQPVPVTLPPLWGALGLQKLSSWGIRGGNVTTVGRQLRLCTLGLGLPAAVLTSHGDTW